MNNALKESPDLSILFVFSECDLDSLNTYLANLSFLCSKNSFQTEVVIAINNSGTDLLSKLEKKKFSFSLRTYTFDINALGVITKRSAQRRFLLDKAEGRYSIFVDENTFFLDFPVEALKKLDHSENVVAIALDYRVLDCNGILWNQKSVAPFNTSLTLEDYIENDFYIPIQNLIFRTDLVSKFPHSHLFAPSMIYHLLSNGEVFFLAKRIMVHRILSKSVSLDSISQYVELIEREIFNRSKQLNPRNNRISFAYCLKKLPLIDFSSLTVSNHVLLELLCFTKKTHLKISFLVFLLLNKGYFSVLKLLICLLKYVSALYLSFSTYKTQSNQLPLYLWDQVPNCGDELSRYITNKLLISIGMAKVTVKKVPSWKNRKLVAIGSLFNFNLLMTDSVYWGTGMLGKQHFFKESLSTNYPLSILNLILPNLFKRLIRRKRSKVLAVRGPLTRNLLIESGIECPEVFGDPALLLSKVYLPKKLPKKAFGLVLHHTHSVTTRSKEFLYSIGGTTIDIACCTDEEIENFINEITSCSKVFSSSLHGIIIAQAYGIPAQWITFKDKPINTEAEFKFKDYFLGAGQENQSPIILEKIEDLGRYVNYAPPPVNEFDDQRLLESFVKAVKIIRKNKTI